jgi:hypothetical protein
MIALRPSPLLALAALGLVGCPGAIDDPAPFVAARMDSGAPPARCPDGVSVTRDLFIPRCATAGCHDTDTQLINLDLESPGVAARLIGRRSAACGQRALVDPSDPERSALLLKLRAAPPCGDRMPVGTPPLSNEEIACVRAWIIRRGEEPDAGTLPDASMSAPADTGVPNDLAR